jgi:glucose uptake protein GlcU
MDGYRMIDMTQPVAISFVIETVGIILGVIALGILMVRNAKRKKEECI